MYKKYILNLSLIASLLILIQSSHVYAEQSAPQDKKSLKVKSDEFAFNICVKDISKDPKAIKAVTGVTTVSSLCGCLKSEMNLLVNEQLAKDLGAAISKYENSMPLSDKDKEVMSDWGARYSAALGGCVNKVVNSAK